MRRACLLALAGCYAPPDLPLSPYQTPLLVEGAFEVCAGERAARVACAVDGDTLDLGACGTGERVRLLGVDAPETGKAGTPSQCGADEATARVTALLDGRRVGLSFDTTCTDAYARTLAYVWLDRAHAERALPAQVVEDVVGLHGSGDDEPLLLSTALLVAGWVRRFDEDWVAPLRFERELVAAERLARVRRSGVWGACE